MRFSHTKNKSSLYSAEIGRFEFSEFRQSIHSRDTNEKRKDEKPCTIEHQFSISSVFRAFGWIVGFCVNAKQKKKQAREKGAKENRKICVETLINV